jgi:UDP-N-acetylglucosamine:LPS N-acetylglucosamine transferase
VLIVTASVGEGHDLPARTLAAQLHREHPGVEVTTSDGLQAMGRLITAVSESAPRVVFYRLEWLWDLGFWAFARFGPTRRLTQAALYRMGAAGLLRLVGAHRPDVIVSTYPHTTEVLGRLRHSGRLDVPVCAAVTDLAALWYWVTPGADVHLFTHPESIDEVLSVAGASAEAHCVHGFTDPAFLQPREEGYARAALGLPAEASIVLVSGGGWGVGNIKGAVEVALGLDRVDLVVCLCGRNEELRRELEKRFAGEERVRIEGFTDQMPDWLAAADVLIHSTAGLTVLEALIRGCPPISFGWGRGHIRLNNAAFRRFGLVDVADTPGELRSALARALDAERSPDLRFSSLPSAASFVLAHVRDGTGRREEDSRDSQEGEREAERSAAEGRIAPALAADERGKHDRDDDLHGHHRGADP